MDEGCMDKGIDGTGYWIAAAGLQLCLQMAGIGETDGGIGDRALLCFRADLFLDDVKMWCLISEFMRFETGYCTRVIILILKRFYVSRFFFFFLWLESRAAKINDYWSVFEFVCSVRSVPHFGINSKLMPQISISA